MQDDQESILSMTPVIVGGTSPRFAELADLALHLTDANARLRSSIPAEIAESLADLMRSMNCYYSNLIEGHHTHPIDIERALADDYDDKQPEKRNLQKEAVAHIAVHKWLDRKELAGRLTTPEAALEIHRRFCELLPDDLLWVEYPDTGERLRVVPGKYRHVYVKVGDHVPVSPGAIPRFLGELNRQYDTAGKAARVIATAALHHRFLWIHPFLDGNGRVARLLSHALLDELLDTRSLWSVSRGLARARKQYMDGLEACDYPRQGDRDGRGSLSEGRLADFSVFFLQTCIDQAVFIERLVEPKALRARMGLWAREEHEMGKLSKHAVALLDALVYRGQVPRGDVAGIIGRTGRQAQRVTAELVDIGAVESGSPRAPLRLAFPVRLAERWLPNLFPSDLPSEA